MKIRRLLINDDIGRPLQLVTNTGKSFVFRTNKDAPNYRLIEIDLDRPEPANWKTLLEQKENDVLDWVDCVAGDKLIVCYMHDVKVFGLTSIEPNPSSKTVLTMAH